VRVAVDQESGLRQCPHCGCSNAVALGTRECPCCGQGYGAQGLADHMTVPDEDARLAPGMLLAAAAVALAIVAAVLISPWVLVCFAIGLVALFIAVRRG